MTRFFSSFDLDQILADDLARREREKKDAVAVTRRETIKKMRAGRANARDAAPSPAHKPSPRAASFALESLSNDFLLRNLVVNGTKRDYLWRHRVFTLGNLEVAKFNQSTWLSTPAFRRFGNLYFDLPSGPEFGSAIVAAYRLWIAKSALYRTELNAFKASLCDALSSGVVTSTQVNYRAHKVATINHCVKRRDHYERQCLFASPSEWLTLARGYESAQLLGVNDAQEFIDATHWLTGMPPYLKLAGTAATASCALAIYTEEFPRKLCIDATFSLNKAASTFGVRRMRATGVTR